MKWTTRKLRTLKSKTERQKLAMLTCYDFQTAIAMSKSNVDLLLVGDSLGNVVLGYDTTCKVSLEEMIVFGSAVKRGAKNKFTIIDMPFGTYANETIALDNAIKLFQKTGAEALKLEGANEKIIGSIKALVNTGIPVVGHIGLTPQFFHQQGGYFTHGKTPEEKKVLLKQAQDIQDAGASLLVLECITPELAHTITKELSIPTIGIGSGDNTDGQVLVINDLLGEGPSAPPSFCRPVKDLFNEKLDAIETFTLSINDKKNPPKSSQGEYENIYN
jgi:3-methyl-2-oxobutanoate hydroxymethyltransferase